VTDSYVVTVENPPRSVEVTPATASIDVAGTVQLSATPRDAGGNSLSGYTVNWSSSDTSVATVDASGLVSGQQNGSATISAEVDDGTGTMVSGTATVQVSASVSTVSVDPTSVFLFPGEQAQINVTLEDANGNTLSGRTVTWASQDTNVATVDASGLISAVAVGATTITAESEGVSATVDLDVVEWTQVSTGDGYSCGVLSNGNGYCWGQNSADGKLGDGTTDSGTDSALNHDNDRTEPTLVLGGLEFDMIEAGFYHTCGLTTAGKAYCWGSNGAGHLGNGTSSPSATPVAVNGTYTFVDISLGANHACALDTSGDVYCWGSNQNGQLGLGANSAQYSLVPQRVPNLQFSSITTGAAHSCGISQAGDAYCWGAGGAGQVGDGNGTDQRAPVQLDSTEQFTVIVAGWNHTCGVTSNAHVYCWGSNQYGELGDGTTTPKNSPVLADDAHTYTDLAAGAGATCGIDANADAYCWGFNGQGNLGNGAPSSSEPSPRLVTGGYDWTAMDLGRQHTCGVASGQADAYCWGDNDYGQLGNSSTSNFLSAPNAVTRP
jgi:alpha-tubulin suppressor-like RCC1 family protein